MTAIDTYLAQIARLLTVPPATRADILQEVRDHLDDAAQQRLAAGMAQGVAEAQACAAFGRPAEVAARFNAAHPLHWDRRRFGVGMLWGIAITWALWTLLTFPALAQLATQGQTISATVAATPWTLLFAATPLAFGLFYVLAADWYWFAPLFLALYAVTPFLWGRRSGNGWLPGLAYGLGVVVGFPWLLPALISRWTPWNPLASILPVAGIWLLLPVAVGAGWLGQRSLWWRFPALRSRQRGEPLRASRRLSPALALASCLGAALLGLNGWSLVRAANIQPAALPPLGQQISAAQANLPFALRQPAYLPSGMTLVSVTAKPHTCLNPCADLAYRGPHGAWLDIVEIALDPSSQPLAAPDDYQVSQGNVGGASPIWWLGDTLTAEHQTAITWEKAGVSFILATNAPLPVDDLEHVAGSMG